MTEGRRAAFVPVSVAALLVSVLACRSGFDGPPGETPAARRVRLFARLLAMEDGRAYEPLLTGHCAMSDDPWLRAKTALAAGRLKDPEASVHLPALLVDEDPAVRRAAAFAAGVSRDPRLARLLARALEDPRPEVAAAAADALGRLGGADAVSALVAAVGRPGAARAAAATALWRSPAGEAGDALLAAREAADADPEVRRAALYALARRPEREALPALRAALTDGDPWVASVAARAVGLLADRESAPPLLSLAQGSEPSPAIQSLLALERLAASGAALPDAAVTVARERAADPAPGIALAALRLLGRCPGEEARAALLSAVEAPGRRAGVALSVLALSDAAGVERIAFPAGPPARLELRLGAAEAVAQLPHGEARHFVERLLDDPSPRVRGTAVGGLSAEAAAASPELLVRALSDPDLAVAAAALETSAKTAGAAAAGTGLAAAFDRAFERCASSGEADFVVSALQAAALLPGGAEERLLRFADATDPVARERARALLASLPGGGGRTLVPRPVPTRFGPADYQRIARRALGSAVTARIETERGGVELELLAEEAPMTVESFVSLAHGGFFDGLLFHRVVPDFVVQGGDPRGDGTGGPGYAVRDELNPVPYERGTVGMALSGPDTGGSQWFVALSPQPHLDGSYTVFGRVASGLPVLDRIEQDDRMLRVRVSESPRPAPPPGVTGH